MKKIFAWLLLLSCVFALSACSIGNGAASADAVNSVSKMYRNSAPTKTVVKSDQKFGDLTL